MPLSEPWISGSPILKPRFNKFLFWGSRLLFFRISGVATSSGEHFWELLFLLLSEVSEIGSWDDLSEIGLRIWSLLDCDKKVEVWIIGYLGFLVESELWELSEEEWWLSSLVVLLFPSLVLLLMLSILPPLLLVVILSVLEYLSRLPLRSKIVFPFSFPLFNSKQSFRGRSLISIILSCLLSLELPGLPLNSEMIFVLPKSSSKALPGICKLPLLLIFVLPLRDFTGRCKSLSRALGWEGRFGALRMLFITSSLPWNFVGSGAVDGGEGVNPLRGKERIPDVPHIPSSVMWTF